ncbi:MAG: carbon storage regulator CsrA [Sedimentisphaerales bacterium]|nr:carbon storage regulator CsrA [Sedimentisphaerales bacterium]
MLVLSRRKDESIVIGENIEVTVTNLNGNKVSLGVTAPKHIPVHRREIYKAVKLQNTRSKISRK